MMAPSHPICLPGPISQDDFPAQTLWVALKRHDLALGFMKFHPVALALVPKVTHPFSQVLTAAPALWQQPASLLRKGTIENIELGELQDGPSRDNPLSHHRSSPWQGSLVRALPVTPASLAQEEQITLHWYQIRSVQVSWLHLFARFGGAHLCELGCAQGSVAPQCVRGRRHGSRIGRLGQAHCTWALVKTSHPALADQSAAVFRCSPSPWASDGGCGAGMGLEIALWSHRMLL